MDSFPPPPQSQAHRHRNAVDSLAVPGGVIPRAATIAGSPAHHQPVIYEVDPSLITPIKPHEQQLRAKKKQLQLQLAIINKSETKPEAYAKAGKKPQEVKHFKFPPVSSSKSLPPLSGRMADLTKGERGVFGKRNTIEFEVNQECTSLALVPSGHLAVAGFSDGTLRIFDLTGTFTRDKNDPRNPVTKESFEFDDDASSSEEEMEMPKVKRGSNEEVCSRVNQRFGVVACQIHARGVHTSLLMDVAVSEDGLYAFGGVLRGSVELAAVYLGDAENYLNERFASGKTSEENNVGLLDLVRVDRHADAKLKGFGAVARLWNGWERTRAGERPEYLLFTGKGIKNIHIWSFKPSRIQNGEEQESIWTCLYDTQTNGTSISQLYFRHNANGLQGISKSDDQKLRVWDLSWEQKRVAEGSDGSDRPKRPNYVDVASTETTVGVCGSHAFALSAASEAIINLIPLDAEDVSSPFNVTELALPMGDAEVGHAMANRPSRSGRQQRGELKSVVNVCGLVFDASHALLNLSDGSLVHYSHDESGHPVLVPCSPALSKTSIDSDVCPSFGAPLAPIQNKKMCLARVGADGNVIMAVSSYNEAVGRGALMFRALPVSAADAHAIKSHRFWGFNGLKRKIKQGTVALVARKKPEPEVRDIPSPTTDAITTLQNTPLPGAKLDDRQQSATTVMPTPASTFAKVAGGKAEIDSVVAPSPVEINLSRHQQLPKAADDKTSNPPQPTRKEAVSSLESSTKTDMYTPTTLQVNHSCNDSPMKQKPSANPKLQSLEKEVMDSQLESLVHQSNKAAFHTPAKHIEKLPEPATKKQKTSASESNSKRASAAESPAPDTPRKSLRRKTRSPQKKAIPSDDHHEPQAEVLPPPKTEESKVCHLGVTFFDKTKEPELPESCYHPKQRAKLLAEKLSRDNVTTRTVKFDLPGASSTKPILTNPIIIKQDEERRKLAAKHRAEHDMIRKQVLNTIRYVISTWDIEMNSTRSYSSVVESAKKWFIEALADHQETLNCMMERQVLESESLAARQTLHLKQRAPMLQVSFPFPEVFEQAKNELYSHFGF